MGKINQLDFQVANLIAAGEVVDRPASACKELVENSIDAGSTNITVDIRNGGVTYMRVSDDGCGMAREDVPLAIRRHATSKIRNAEDLDSILTLGFRGEALAAISSVASVRILTKRREDEMGTLLESEPGMDPVISEVGTTDGTTIVVENLFENIPARRKFLKKDQTEAMALTGSLEKVALSHPEIGIRLIIDGQTRFATAGDGILKNTIYSILGRDFALKMIELNRKNEGIEITGFIGTPENVRANRNYQNFFINGRYIKSRCAQAALEQAFISNCPSEKFPTCVMNIRMNPSAVDVNVHPAKLEVKFANERQLFEEIYYAVKGALETAIPVPKLNLNGKTTSEANWELYKQLNAFVPLRDRVSEPPAKRSPYNNQRSVKEGQISTEDVLSEPAAAALPVSRPAERQTTVPSHPTGYQAAAPASRRPADERRSDNSPQLKSESFSQDPNESALPDYRKPLYKGGIVVAPNPFDPGCPYSPGEPLNPENPETMIPFAIGDPGIQRPNPNAAPPAFSESPAIRAFRKAMEKQKREAVEEAARKAAEADHSAPESAVSRPAADRPASLPAETSADAASIADIASSADFVSSAGLTSADPISHDPVPAQPAPEEKPAKKLPPFRIVGEVFLSYVIVEIEDRMMLIDKHAAHERILFESLKENRCSDKVASQILLIPLEVSLTPLEIAAVKDYEADVKAVGFEFYAKDDRLLIVSAIPTSIEASAAPDLLETIADRLASGTGSAEVSRGILFEKALYQASCKAAIKIGHDEDAAHIRWIVEQLLMLDDIKFCPHGRPVAFELTKHEIEHQFRRA